MRIWFVMYFFILILIFIFVFQLVEHYDDEYVTIFAVKGTLERCYKSDCCNYESVIYIAISRWNVSVISVRNLILTTRLLLNSLICSTAMTVDNPWEFHFDLGYLTYL